MKKTFQVLVGFVLLIAIFGCASNNATEVLATSNTPPPTMTQTLTPTKIPRPTNSPTPTPVHIDFFDFMLPVDFTEILDERHPYSAPITLHIAHRPDPNDPCGGHPGDALELALYTPDNISANEKVNFDVFAPYSGIVQNIYTEAGGGGAVITFYLGENNSTPSYLDIIHIDNVFVEENQWVEQGDKIAELTTFREHGSLIIQLHLALARDRSAFDHPENYLDITPFLIPTLLLEARRTMMDIVITYEGPNYCNMNSLEKINALTGYVSRAGYVVEGNEILDPNGNIFHWTKYDERSIKIKP
jgi:hypothetical protein